MSDKREAARRVAPIFAAIQARLDAERDERETQPKEAA